MGRRIKRAQIKTISLVPRGHNNLPVLYKGDTQQIVFSPISKMSDQGELTALVYIPETRDAEGDIASAEVIRDMAHGYARDGVGIDILHDNKPVTKDRAYVAESFIVQKGDPRFADFKDTHGKVVDPTGGWGVVMKIEDPELRALYKSGAWNGVSMYGPAALEIEKGLSDSDIADLTERLAKRLQSQPQDIDMTPEDLKKSLDAQTTTLAASIPKGIVEALMPILKPEAKKEEPKAEPKTDEAPVFKGDVTDPKALEAHRKALLRWQLAKGTDMSDPKAIENLIASLSKGSETSDPANESDEVKKLKAERDAAQAKLDRLQKGSTAATTGSGKALTKDEQFEADLVKGGLEMAAAVNKSRGFLKPTQG